MEHDSKLRRLGQEDGQKYLLSRSHQIQDGFKIHLFLGVTVIRFVFTLCIKQVLVISSPQIGNIQACSFGCCSDWLLRFLSSWSTIPNHLSAIVYKEEDLPSMSYITKGINVCSFKMSHEEGHLLSCIAKSKPVRACICPSSSSQCTFLVCL